MHLTFRKVSGLFLILAVVGGNETVLGTYTKEEAKVISDLLLGFSIDLNAATN